MPPTSLQASITCINTSVQPPKKKKYGNCFRSAIIMQIAVSRNLIKKERMEISEFRVRPRGDTDVSKIQSAAYPLGAM